MRKIAFVLSFLAISAFAQDPFAAKPGEAVYGEIAIPAGADAATSIPVAVIHGATTGPVVAFVAGSHGTEYASTVALTRLISRIDPKTLRGTVIVAPLVNVASFEQMTVHLNPIDHKSMNGNYPGDAHGTQTQRVLAAVADQIVKRADLVVDLHGGDLDEELVPYSYWFRTGNAAQDATSKALALAFGLNRIIVEDVDLSNPASTRTLSGYTASLGKMAVVAEAGHNGTVEPRDVKVLIDGCLNILGVRQMIERTPRVADHPVWVGGGARVRADGPGMWFPAVHGGDTVAEGMVLGRITDYLGRPVKDVRAPTAGIVTFIRPVPSVWKDATLANVAPVIAEPKM